MEVLESIAKMTAPVDPGFKTSLQEVLQDFHSARDKHIFRLLSTIASPDHSAKARERVWDDMSKRTKPLGDAVSQWVRNLTRRCAMGNSLNSGVIQQCISLAQECFREGDVPACGALLATVKTAVDIFPAMCSSEETYAMLTELFSECREATGEIRNELNASGIVTVLSSILSSITMAIPGDKVVRPPRIISRCSSSWLRFRPSHVTAPSAFSSGTCPRPRNTKETAGSAVYAGRDARTGSKRDEYSCQISQSVRRSGKWLG